MKIEEATAGSILMAFNNRGTNAPKNPATTRFVTIAKNNTTPSRKDPCQMAAIIPTIRPVIRPFKNPAESSLAITKVADFAKSHKN